MKIEVNCDYCRQKNEKAERLIEGLRRDLELKEEQYEIFKEVARRELNRRKSFFGWLFS